MTDERIMNSQCNNVGVLCGGVRKRNASQRKQTERKAQYESNFLPTHFELIKNVTAECKRYKCGFMFRRESRTQSTVKLNAYS